MVIEVREAPVPVRGWDIHESGNKVMLNIEARHFEAFVFVSMRPLSVLLSNGQKIIVRSK